MKVKSKGFNKSRIKDICNNDNSSCYVKNGRVKIKIKLGSISKYEDIDKEHPLKSKNITKEASPKFELSRKINQNNNMNKKISKTQMIKTKFHQETDDKFFLDRSMSQRPIRKKKHYNKFENFEVFSENNKGAKKQPLKPIKMCLPKSRKDKIQKGRGKKIENKIIKKKKNNERRKEKSRDAARCRRGKESEIFGELGDLLPLETPLSAGLDKASVIRVAISYIRTRNLVNRGLDIPCLEDVTRGSTSGCEDLLTDYWSSTSSEGVLEALDGFLIVLTKDGDVVYTSENISTFLGLSQIDVIGHSLLDYTHPCDHDEVRTLSTLVDSGPRNTFLRFKCTLTPKGRSVNLKSACYKVVQITGQVLTEKEDKAFCSEEFRGEDTWIVALGVPVPHPSNIEVPLDKQTFVSKHSLDMKFTYVDENVEEFCGYQPVDLLGRSVYQLNHALDTQLVRDSYKTLRSKGQVETGQYRFLAHGGGYVWVVTQATLITGHRDSKPQYVVCLNYVISEVEFGDIIFSDCQLKTVKTENLTSCSQAAPKVCGSPIVPAPLSSLPVILPCDQTLDLPSAPSVLPANKPSPVAATCSLLRDRTEDMNEGYLTFTDNDSHATILKEEPEDLTHLAPSVGEDCIPLEVPIYLPIFDDILGPEPDFYLPKETGSSVNFKEDVEGASSSVTFKEDLEGAFENLFNEPPLTIQINKGATNLVPGPQVYEATPEELRRRGLESLIPGDLQFRTEPLGSGYIHRVPESGGLSPLLATISPVTRFDTPDSTLSPLLSQTASPTTPGKHKNVYFCEPKPTPATTKLFTQLYEENSTSSTMDLFNSFDLKLEEDLELRAPYIPPIDEVLVFDQDDLFGISSNSSNNNNNNDSNERRDDMSCYREKQKKDDLGIGASSNSFMGGSYSPQHSFQNIKLGNDMGSNFVDPNQVLPGQFYIKGEDKDNLQELRYLLEAPPPSPVKEPVDPPPPLKQSNSSAVYNFIKAGAKRPPSPSNFTLTKKLRPSGYSSTSQTNHRRDLAYAVTTSQKPDLPTPHAPLMQQLLVSKEPIRVRGRVVSSPISTAQEGGRSRKAATNPPHQSQSHTHSVLRNLLVSGRDERAGYTVVMSNLSTGDDDSKNGDGDKGDDPAASFYPLQSFPLNKEGKIELTRQQLSDLLDRAGALRPSFRVMQEGESMPPTPPESFSPLCFSPATPATPADTSRDNPILMFGSSLSSIPTLFDITSFDCEVNAPAPDPSLLQGSELLLALEQTQ